MPRPRKYFSDDPIAEARAIRKAKQAELGVQSIAVEGDVIAQLDDCANGLTPLLGFKPTLEQTIRWLVKNRGFSTPEGA